MTTALRCSKPRPPKDGRVRFRAQKAGMRGSKLIEELARTLKTFVGSGRESLSLLSNRNNALTPRHPKTCGGTKPCQESCLNSCLIVQRRSQLFSRNSARLRRRHRYRRSLVPCPEAFGTERRRGHEWRASCYHVMIMLLTCCWLMA